MRTLIGVCLVASLAPGCDGGTSTTTQAFTTTTTAYSSADGLKLVRSIYDPYARATSVGTALMGDCFLGGRTCDRLDRNLTPELTAKLSRDAVEGTGRDPVICAQNTPVRVEYDPPARSGTTLTIVVHTFYSDGGDNPVRVVVDLNTLKLADLVCPG